MAGNLFPVFDVPAVTVPGQSAKRRYPSSVCFDFETGDFLRDGACKLVPANGFQTYMQWCRKVCATERNRFLAYSSDVGIEAEAALNQMDRAAVESALERAVTETLMVNVHTEYVRNFKFTWDSDSLLMDFTVKAKQWPEESMQAAFNF